MSGQHQIIKETTDTLVELLTETFKEAGYKRVHVVVEAPKPDAIEGKLPAVCLYLYQLAPDWEGIAFNPDYEETVRERLPSGRIVEYQLNPPAWVRLDYIISTWAQTPEDEQLLLGLAVKGLTDTRVVEGDRLKGASFPKNYQMPLTMHSKMDEGTQARFWGSLNQPIRPALSIYAVVPIMSDVRTPFQRVEERVIGYKRLNDKEAPDDVEYGPDGKPDMPPESPTGQFVKRKSQSDQPGE